MYCKVEHRRKIAKRLDQKWSTALICDYNRKYAKRQKPKWSTTGGGSYRKGMKTKKARPVSPILQMSQISTMKSSNVIKYIYIYLNSRGQSTGHNKGRVIKNLSPTLQKVNSKQRSKQQWTLNQNVRGYSNCGIACIS